MVVGGSEATRRLLNGQKLEKRLKKEKERKRKENINNFKLVKRSQTWNLRIQNSKEQKVRHDTTNNEMNVSAFVTYFVTLLFLHSTLETQAFQPLSAYFLSRNRSKTAQVTLISMASEDSTPKQLDAATSKPHCEHVLFVECGWVY